MEEIYQKIK